MADKETKVYRFAAKSHEDLGEAPVTDEGYLIERKVHDEKGNLLVSEELGEGEVASEKLEYSYDEKGRIILHRHYFAGELSEEVQISYNEFDKPSREVITFLDGSKTENIYEYDESGHIKKKRVQDEGGEIEIEELFEYSDGNLVRHTRYNSSGELVDEFKFEYGEEEGKKVLKEEHEIHHSEGVQFRTVHSKSGSVTYDKKGGIYSTVKKVFDEKGRETENHVQTLNRQVSIFYQYNDKDLLTGEERQNGSMTTFISRRIYNEEGKLRFYTITDASSGLFTDYYVYG
jgi:hypothetical protein